MIWCMAATHAFAAQNQTPYVSAGTDRQIVLPETNAVLSGLVIDDGLPVSPGVTTALWTQVSGPGGVTFQDPAVVNTTASFPTTGVYVLSLAAYDGAAFAFDQVTISVLATAPTNCSPTVTCPPDATVFVGDVLSIPGHIVDDMLVDSSLRIDWTKQSGPGTVKMTGFMMYILVGGIGDPPTGKVYTTSSSTACFYESGTYVLRLTADDRQFAPFDEMTVIALPRPASLHLTPESGGGQTIVVPTEPHKTYAIAYTDDNLSGETAWTPFADASNGVGTWIETNTVPASFTFVDDEGPSTTGGPTPGVHRYYRITYQTNP